MNDRMCTMKAKCTKVFSVRKEGRVQVLCRKLCLTEQSLKLGRGMMAFVLAIPSPAGVVILTSIVHALLFASVNRWLGFTICTRSVRQVSA